MSKSEASDFRVFALWASTAFQHFAFDIRHSFDIRYSTFDIPKSPVSTAEWQIIVSVVLAALLAFGPWMLMVHGKLAVLVAKLAELARDREAPRPSSVSGADGPARGTARSHEIQLDYLASDCVRWNRPNEKFQVNFQWPRSNLRDLHPVTSHWPLVINPGH